MKSTTSENSRELTGKELLMQGAAEYSLMLDGTAADRLMKFKEMLLDWNRRMNLTSIENDREIYIKHFIDSFSIAPWLRPAASEGGSLIDVGTGAGFPGIPVKIACGNMDVTLLDSLEKRVGFLKAVISETGLTGIRAVHGRAEDFGVKPEHRERYGAAVARAVAPLPVLLEYCLPFVKTGGLFIAMKGEPSPEIEASGKALDVLGGKIEEVKELVLPFSDYKRSIIIIKKFRQTPTKYPRKAGTPTKKPLV